VARFPAGIKLSLFSKTYRNALGTTAPRMQWITIASSSRVKQPERLANLSLPSSLQVKNAWINISSPPTLLYGTYSTFRLLFSFSELSWVTTAVRMSYHVNVTVFIEPDSTQVRKGHSNYCRQITLDIFVVTNITRLELAFGLL
jgi:hypothetical protein